MDSFDSKQSRITSQRLSRLGPPKMMPLNEDGSEALVTDGFVMPHLDSPQATPPAYGQHHDQVQFSQPGFEAGAAVTSAFVGGDGRVNININTKNRRLADLLAPTLSSQVPVEPQQAPAPSLPHVPPGLGPEPGTEGLPPALNVVIQIVGSRGDIQPFVALGKVLKDDYGHRVRIATHGTFQDFVMESGLDFFNIGGDPTELMAFMVKHPGLMPGIDALKSGEISKRRRGIQEILLGCWRSCIEAGNGSGPPLKPHARNEPLDLSAGLPGDESQEPFVADAIIANPPSFAHIHIAEKLGIPLHMMFTMPWSPTRAFPHPLANIQSSNADDVMTNYMTYTLVEMMTWQGLGDVINRFREKALDLPPLSFIWAPGLLGRLKIPYTYCWSPTLIPKPNDWGRNIDISGFYFLNLASSYRPDPALASFLQAGPLPVYIGFGSIVVDDPNALTRMIFDAIHLSGVRALVSQGWGGLGADDVGIPEGVHMLGNVPHDWLFEHVSAVVHHGGAGTTAAGIKVGKPTFVVPFFGDQPFWGAMIARARAGPEPIRYKDLTPEKLAEAIQFCLEPDTQQQAKELGQKIREERGTTAGGKSFHRHLDIESLRCSVAPSRAATWRVRRSKVRLSPLAAAVLVSEGLLQYNDVKLYRPHEYNTEDQPPDPISAGACSLVGDISSIGMAIADMPREIFRSSQKSKEISSQPPKTWLEVPARLTHSSSHRMSMMDSSTELCSVASPALADGDRDTGACPPHEPIVSPNTSQIPLADLASAMTSVSESERTNSTEHTRPRASSTQLRSAFTLRESSPLGVSVGVAVGAGRNVGRAVSTGVKSPMNFCLGLAKGFRNVPKLYNDDTIRPIEKVTDLSSGLKIAGKELGYGFFDGIAGLVTQPIRGAEKEGAGGFVKGFGKGIGGLIAKPAAGIWGVPAYMMQGVHAEVSKLFTRSVQNYIMTSRVYQGQQDFDRASAGQKDEIIRRWNDMKFDLKNFYMMKRKDKTATSKVAAEITTDSPLPIPKTSWIRTRHLPLDERKKVQAQKELCKDYVDNPALSRISSPTKASSGSSVRPSIFEDAEYEQAIRTSVQETSRGNAEEDATIEAFIRESVKAMRQRGGLPKSIAEDAEKSEMNIFDNEELQINDEEFQALIEQALQQSLEHHMTNHGGAWIGGRRAPSSHDAFTRNADADKVELRRAIEASKAESLSSPRWSCAEVDDEEELQRAITASKKDMERESAQRTEEGIVLEYVKKQSLVEEQLRQQMRKSKGRALQAAGVDQGEGDDDGDEALRKALKESLRLHGEKNGDGSSGLQTP